MNKKRKRIFLIFLALFAILCLFPMLTGRWIIRELESRMGIKVEGRFVQVIFFPAFNLYDVRLAWDDKVKLGSGNLKVEYSFFSLFQGHRLRIKISSKDLSGELLGKWSEAQGVKEVKFHRFYADLLLGRKGIEEIYELHAEAPNLHFNIQQSGALKNNQLEDQRESI